MAAAPVIPRWGLWMMFLASLVGTILLARELLPLGWG